MKHSLVSVVMSGNKYVINKIISVTKEVFLLFLAVFMLFIMVAEIKNRVNICLNLIKNVSPRLSAH